MDTLRLAFGFLMFHRRTIIGLLLLVGLYYFITDVVPRIAAARRESVAKSSSQTSSLNPPSSSGQPTSSQPSSSRQPSESEKPKKDEPSSVIASKSTNTLVKSENAEELIKELIRLKASSKQSSNDGLSLIISADVIKISKRLLELPIDLNQRKFAIGSLAESLLFMRLFKINSNLADESIDVEFLEKTKELLNHPDPVISSYAAVTIVTSALFDYHINPTDDRFTVLEKLLEDHFNQIAVQPEQLKRFTQVLLTSNLPKSDIPKVKELLNRLKDRFDAHEDPDVIEAGRAFMENLTFRKLDIDNLVFRLGDRTADSDLRVDAFFEALQDFPAASIPAYQISMDVIREYILQDKNERALQLAEKIEKDILPNRKHVETRERIQAALNQLKDIIQQKTDQ